MARYSRKDASLTLDAHIVITWPALNLEVELRLESGRTLAIMGPNGAGKSTVLRALAGLTPIHRGRISMDGVVWDDPARDSFVEPGSRNVGLVFQDHLLFRHLTVLDNVAFGPRARGLDKRSALANATECLEQFGLESLADVHPSRLSGGQSQRVALARALVNGPRLLLLDEPLAALDVLTRRHMRQEIARGIGRTRPTTILVTHDPEDARQMADEVVVIENGSVVQRGSVEELVTRPATAYISELFAGG